MNARPLGGLACGCALAGTLAAASASAQEAPAQDAVAEPGVRLHVKYANPEDRTPDSPEPRLEMRGPNDSEWTSVCYVPCSRTVPPGNEYRIAGPGVRGSRAFRLPGGDAADVRVGPVTQAHTTTGIALVAAGPVLMAGGFLAFVVGAVQAANSGDGGGGGGGLVALGIGAGAVGLASLVVGIVFVVQRTGVDVTEASRSASARDDRWLRLPDRREASPGDVAWPKAAGIPLYAVSF